MLTNDPIRPLHDVWLRPRRVFRELAARPIGRGDYVLGAAQGMVGWLALSRAQNAGAVSSVADIFGKALLVGGVSGIASLFLYAGIYARLGSSGGHRAAKPPLIHVLAYGGVPLAASLLVWMVAALGLGDVTFQEAPKPGVDGLVAWLLRLQFVVYMFLLIWSVVIQIMGLSEMLAVAPRRAFGLWLLGQLIASLAMLLLIILIIFVFPSALGG